MTIFARLLSANDKESALRRATNSYRAGAAHDIIFEAPPASFHQIPGAPFAYWLSEKLRGLFKSLPSFSSEGRVTKQGLATADDFRFARLWWEPSFDRLGFRWHPFLKGGGYSPFYAEIPLVVGYSEADKAGYMSIGRFGRGATHYYLPGLTWPSRPHRRGTFSLVPSGTIFSVSGMMLFQETKEQLLVTCALLNSSPYLGLLHSIMPRGGDGSGQTLKYELVYLAAIPVPIAIGEIRDQLSELVLRGWLLGRLRDSIDECSHAFLSPALLRIRRDGFDLSEINQKILSIQSKIDEIASTLYGVTVEDISSLIQSTIVDNQVGTDTEDEDFEPSAEEDFALISWAAGVAFGHFDWRLATGERAAPSEPEPFDPLPSKSPGMLPDGAEPFHAHTGILVDDQGHLHDLARLVEEVLNRVDVSVPDDIRRWLRKDFFAFHLQRYSKSRRKAPIYWPLATASGNYTLWVYYPSLNNQTLFTAVNDFLDGPNGKLTQISRDCAELRIKGSSRSRDEEKQYEILQTFEQELTDLRDTLLKIARTYQPNHDDGVQITAAPLWPLFRHKPWQKLLKDTWAKLEKGDYDWAHLAMTYWPERVHEKCKTDKSLAIAHGLEDLYVEPEAPPKKSRGKKAGANE